MTGELANNVNQPSIPMGQFQVALEAGILRTLLGSCIGLALYDRRYRVAGLAHIVLPDSQGRSAHPGKFVDTAIPSLIDQMQEVAGAELKPTAKLVGGASMFSTTTEQNIGVRNVEASERLLAALRIPVVARHCGGQQGRRMLLDVRSGKVVVEIVGRDPIEL